MQKKNIQGIWCRETNKFYYFETGRSPGHNNVDRLRTILTSRDLIKANPLGPSYGEEPYLIMSLSEAEKKEYEVEVIYMNSHIEAMAKEEMTKEIKSAWS